MSFTVIDCEQRSPAWFAARAGILTATGAAAMLSTLKRSGEPVGKTRLRVRLAIETLNGAPVLEDRYESDAMRVGREREADAISAYELETQTLVQSVGFLRHDTLPIGCSPDGIVGDFQGGVEVKCPEEHTHVAYAEEGHLPPEYLPQILHSLYVTGLPWWDFCSYCPVFKGGLRLFRVRVLREDVDVDGYALALQLFLTEVERLTEKLRDWDRVRELTYA